MNYVGEIPLKLVFI